MNLRPALVAKPLVRERASTLKLSDLTVRLAKTRYPLVNLRPALVAKPLVRERASTLKLSDLTCEVGKNKLSPSEPEAGFGRQTLGKGEGQHTIIFRSNV